MSRGRSTACPSKAPGARIRCRSPRPATTTPTWSCSKSGCAATARRSSSTSAGALGAEIAALRARGRPAHEREPARQRRHAAARAEPAGLPRLRGRGRATGRGVAARRRACSARSCATSSRRTPTNFRIVRAGRDGVEPAGRRVRGDRPRLAGRAHRDDEHLAPDGRVMEVLSRAPLPGLAGGLSAHRAPRTLQLLRGVHPHRRLDVQSAREVAQDVAARFRGACRSRHSTTCSPRTCGGRTTTASRTRIRASSTTS